MKIVIFCIVALFVWGSQAMVTDDTDELVFVLQLIRHGARDMIYPIYENITDDPTFGLEQGELTEVGKRQHYILGRAMRKKYIENPIAQGLDPFISEVYNAYQIYVRASPYNRTIQSAYSFLMGFYLPGSGPVLPSKIANTSLPPFKLSYDVSKVEDDLRDAALAYYSQSLPVHGVGSHDALLSTMNICPSFFGKFQTISKDSDEISKINDFYKEKLYPRLKEEIPKVSLSEDSFSISTAYQIYDDYICAQYEGDKTNFSEPTITLLKNASVDSLFHVLLGQDENVQIVNQNYFKEIKDRLMNASLIEEEGKIDKSQRLRMAFYFAHDVNIGAFLKAMNYSVKSPIPFASNVVIELYKKKVTNDASYYVTVKYNYDTDIPMNGTLNPSLDEFATYLNSSTYQGDFNKLCNEKDSKVDNYDKGKYITVSIIVAVVMAIIIIISCILIHRKTKRTEVSSLLADPTAQEEESGDESEESESDDERK